MQNMKISKSTSYSLFYFAVYCFVAYQVAFFPLFLKSLSLSSFEIALICAAATLGTVSGPPIALRLAHNSIAGHSLFPSYLLFALIAFLPIFFSSQLLTLSLFWFLCSAATKSAQALLDARAVRESVERRLIFERVRLWGSLGFVVSTVLLGILYDAIGDSAILFSGAALLLINFLFGKPTSAYWKKENSLAKYESSTLESNYRKQLFQLLLVNVLIWSSHQVLYIYYSIYLKELGWSGVSISVAWTVGVLSEILVFLAFRHLESRFSLSAILKLSVVLTTLRWFLIYYSSYTPLLYFAQVLHAFSFGTFYLSSVKLVFQILPDKLRDRGQGYLMASGLGLGSLAGRIIAGFASTHLSIPQLFLGAALVAALSYPVARNFNSTSENQVRDKRKEE